MTTPRDDLTPDFLRMEGRTTTPAPSDERGTGTWYGWSSPNTAQPVTLLDKQERVERVRTPVLDLEGLMTPTHLFYVVQHFDVPQPMRPEDWRLTIDGSVHAPITLAYGDLRRLPLVLLDCGRDDVVFGGGPLDRLHQGRCSPLEEPHAEQDQRNHEDTPDAEEHAAVGGPGR